MTRIRPLEVKALTPLLIQDWPSPEELAAALITTLDQTRADRTSYVSVAQFGFQSPVYYVGLGPYPGMASARKAVTGHPGYSLATKIVTVPLLSPAGLTTLLNRVGLT